MFLVCQKLALISNLLIYQFFFGSIIRSLTVLMRSRARKNGELREISPEKRTSVLDYDARFEVSSLQINCGRCWLTIARIKKGKFVREKSPL